MEQYREALFVFGMLNCLSGAGLILDGAILGETTTFATVLGTKGIRLIATQKRISKHGGE